MREQKVIRANSDYEMSEQKVRVIRAKSEGAKSDYEYGRKWGSKKWLEQIVIMKWVEQKVRMNLPLILYSLLTFCSLEITFKFAPSLLIS